MFWQHFDRHCGKNVEFAYLCICKCTHLMHIFISIPDATLHSTYANFTRAYEQKNVQALQQNMQAKTIMGLLIGKDSTLTFPSIACTVALRFRSYPSL